MKPARLSAGSVLVEHVVHVLAGQELVAHRSPTWLTLFWLTTFQ